MREILFRQLACRKSARCVAQNMPDDRILEEARYAFDFTLLIRFAHQVVGDAAPATESHRGEHGQMILPANQNGVVVGRQRLIDLAIPIQ